MMILRRLEWIVALAGLGLGALIVRQAWDPALMVMIVTAAVGGLIVWIALQDLKTFTISDSAIVTVAILAVAYRWSVSVLSGESMLATCLASAFDGLLPGGMLLLFREIYYRRKGFDGLGLGDVKLAGAGGLLVGAVGFSWALLASSLLGLVVVGLNRVLAKMDRFKSTRRGRPLDGSDKLAFGALLAPALWTVWVAEQLPMLLPYADR